MRDRVAVAGTIFGILGIGLVAFMPAARAADAEAGQRLVRQWCTSCHVAEGRTGTDMAPPLSAVVNERQRKEGYLRAWLADPHPPMPNLSLTKQEIDDIVAYLETLKR